MMIVPLIITLLFHNTDSHQKFIASLYQKQDYYQCIAELRRYSMATGNDMDYSIAYCYYQGKRFTEALTVLKNKPDKETRHYLLLANIYTALQHYTDALQTLYMCDSDRDLGLQPYLYKNILAVHVASYDWDTALSFYNSHSDALNQMRDIFALLKQAKQETKNPYAAAVLSAMMPGAGHAYAYHYTDGIISFVTVAILAGATYLSYTKGKTELMYTFGTLTAIGYAGNVYSAYTSTLHSNEIINSNYRTQIQNQFLQYSLEIFLPEWMRQ
ncbi:MAG: CDC27 family protein [Spirochaetota bacterium]